MTHSSDLRACQYSRLFKLRANLMGHAVQHVINSKPEPDVFGFDWEEPRSGHLPIFGKVGIVIDDRHQAFVGIVVFE